ncbi:ABC transporter permease [Salipiger sp. P9]|uniref:ABC transporter permease n=1 Tax=Salipiger pentaromativorans TaxID=2943193 RepID=UPI002157F7A4|nr:ABC transporter permease [Salipiger pentaromativorans]MCR8547503.1 ABC transporter permease [Salipiger pentaromativorans]
MTDQGLSRWAAFWNSDILYEFRRSPLAIVGFVVAGSLILSALLAPILAPYDPYDASGIDLMNGLIPPFWSDGGNMTFPLGTDNQGRDVFSGILYGLRLSLTISVSAVLLSALVGTALGLVAAWVGGWFDSAIMRLADIQLSFPAILIALLVDGVARNVLPQEQHASLAMPIVILAIAISGWVQYARTVRSIAMVEKGKDYVEAARLIGVNPVTIAMRHILPNATGSIFVLGTVHLAIAILTEATLSFLGLGMPPTEPSIGTLIRIGNDFLFSGEWWITILPGVTLALLVLSVNLLGDWLRDALNPQLR